MRNDERAFWDEQARSSDPRMVLYARRAVITSAVLDDITRDNEAISLRLGIASALGITALGIALVFGLLFLRMWRMCI